MYFGLFWLNYIILIGIVYFILFIMDGVIKLEKW